MENTKQNDYQTDNKLSQIATLSYDKYVWNKYKIYAFSDKTVKNGFEYEHGKNSLTAYNLNDIDVYREILRQGVDAIRKYGKNGRYENCIIKVNIIDHEALQKAGADSIWYTPFSENTNIYKLPYYIKQMVLKAKENNISLSEWVIDEKCVSRDIEVPASKDHQPMPGLAFELMGHTYEDSNSFSLGWLIKDNITDFYIYETPKCRPCIKKHGDIKVDDLIEFKSITVAKKDILKYLEKNGYTKEMLVKTAKKILTIGKFTREDKLTIDIDGKTVPLHRTYNSHTSPEGIHFNRSYEKTVGTCPVNVIIEKKVLFKLCAFVTDGDKETAEIKRYAWYQTRVK